MRRFFELFVSIFLVAAVAGCASSGSRYSPASVPAPDKRTERVYVLQSGLTLIIKESRHEGPVSVQVWVRGGSMTDPSGKAGLAHLVERTLLSGSMGYPSGGAGVEVEKLGGRLFGSTGRDFSYFGVTVPSQRWQRAAGILYDVIARPDFNPVQVEKERKVILNEIRAGAGGPEGSLLDGLFKAAFRLHPYRNPVAGSPDEINSIISDDLNDYYSRTYIPAHMVVVVCGSMDPWEAKEKVENTFGLLTQAGPSRLDIPREAPLVARRQTVEDMPVHLTYIAYGWRAVPASDPDAYALEVLGAVLGDGRGSRLNLELRQRKGLAYNVRSTYIPLRYQGMLVVYADLIDGENLRPVTDEVLRQIDKVKSGDVSQQEIDRAVARLEGSRFMASDTAEGQAYWLGYWETVYGGMDPAEYIRNIRAVTPDDLRRVALRYLGEGNYALAIIEPKGGRK